MSIMNQIQTAPPGATPIPPSGGTGAPTPKVDIGGVCAEYPNSKVYLQLPMDDQELIKRAKNGEVIGNGRKQIEALLRATKGTKAPEAKPQGHPNPPQPTRTMVSPYADTMLYGILSPAHPKPECPSSTPWDDATTAFQDAFRKYAIKLQTAIQSADMNEFAYRAVRRENDELKAKVAELERQLAQLRGDGFAVS